VSKEKILTLSLPHPCNECGKPILPGEIAIQIYAFKEIQYHHYDGKVCISNRYGKIFDGMEPTHA
jgi:hypothetical protein